MEIDCIFSISASSKDLFLERLLKVEAFGFNIGLLASYEKDVDADIWKTITVGYFQEMKDLKETIEEMKKYDWLNLSDSSMLLDGQYIFSSGDWVH